AAGKRIHDLETTRRTFTGRRRDVIVRWAVLPGYEETFSRVLVSTIDITERKRMEEQLGRQERLAAVGQFAGGIAHDFRNFLTTIILYAGMPLRQPDLDPQVARALEVISTEARQAADLIQQIVDFSGRTAADVRPVDLVQTIREGIDILRLALPETISLNLALEPAEAVVEVDSTRIQQVLMNLVLNARDAMPEGGDLDIALSRLTIGPDEDPPLAGLEPGPWVCLTVSDTGTGMTDEVKERIFEPYFTTKEPEQGTGLGLSQVYGIVKQHHGAIHVWTELGSGTTFKIYLPAFQEHEVAPEHGPAVLPPGGGEAVLLVEDQDTVREAGRELLTDLGYRVLVAANGEEALELLQEMNVDLVIADAVMPVMGGAALMRELAGRFPHLPALAVTGDTGAEGLREAGFSAVLRKPFDTLALAQTVRRVLDAQ
ncbi:MAG: ATP-binding protein, partial [Chloroflexota bacterium]